MVKKLTDVKRITFPVHNRTKYSVITPGACNTTPMGSACGSEMIACMHTVKTELGTTSSAGNAVLVHQVASWWDYGYQTTAMANRTVIVDNNTWNNTHIATVGRAMASPEHKAWQIYRDLDVKYVLVVFGGFVG